MVVGLIEIGRCLLVLALTALRPGEQELGGVGGRTTAARQRFPRGTGGRRVIVTAERRIAFTQGQLRRAPCRRGGGRCRMWR